MSIGACALLVLALIMMSMGIPLAFLAGALIFSITTGLSTGSWGSTAWFSTESFSLLAVPLFILAGTLMERSGIAGALVDFGQKLTDKNGKGTGLANAIPVVSAMFGALCGSGLATCSTMCSMLGPRLTEKGYKKEFVYALIALSSPFGFMIPPNMNAIIYAKVANASVADLFMATVVPGIIWVVLYIIINRFMVPKYYTPGVKNSPADPAQVAAESQKAMSNWRLFRSLIPALLMPVIILGGIYTGVFTATEAGAVGCLYGLIVGVLIYKSVKTRDLFDIFADTAYSIGSLQIIFPFTMIFTRIMVTNGVPQMVTDFVTGISENKFVIILILNLVLFIAGFFLDGNILLLVLTPLLLPTALSIGMSSTQFAVLVFVALGIGSITPPMAMSLFVSARLGNVPVEDMVKPMIPYIVFGALPIMVLVSFVPAASEFLPALLH